VAREIDVRVRGRRFQLTREAVEAALRGVEPDPLRALCVEVNGRLYPVKQALQAATGADIAGFNSHQAWSTFERLGMRVERVA
jgi:hypothetical protein